MAGTSLRRKKRKLVIKHAHAVTLRCIDLGYPNLFDRLGTIYQESITW